MNKPQVRDLWSQLKKRKVVRVAWVYLLVSLLIILIATVTFQNLGLPAYVLSLLLVVILLGFPVALFLAWAFEITPYGIRKDSAGDIETTTKVEKHTDSMPSIAVLPFEDLSENGDQTYFCEGLAEEILDVLRKTPNLRVASRFAAFELGSEQADIREVGRKLNVQLGLTGACKKTADKLHVKVQLIDTSDGSERWARQYDRPLEDIFEIQEEVENSVMTILNVAKPGLFYTPRPLVSKKSYDLFLHGLSCFAKHTTQDNV